MNGRQNRTPSSMGGENLKRLAVSAALLTLAACGGGGDGSDTETLDLSNLQGVPEVAAAYAGDVDAANTASVEAQIDVAETTAGTPIIVSILQNDNFSADTQMQLVGQPANGTAVLLASGEVEYIANPGFEGTDEVEYVLVDADGNQSLGTLYIAVGSTAAPAPALAAHESGLTYCQDSHPDPDGDGYGWEDNASCALPATGAALGPLTAKTDLVQLVTGQIQTITPLNNDTIADRANVEFAIDVEPSVGTILAAEAGAIVYQAPLGFVGVDSMVYSITDDSGATSMANIEFNVVCITCDDNKALRLTWSANPDSEGVDGYRVLFGSDENPLTSTVVSEVQVANLNGAAPKMVFDLEGDLNIAGGEGGCFMIQAYRGTETSEASEATCFTRI